MLNQYAREAVIERMKQYDVRKQLQRMVDDPNMMTSSSYSANGEMYPDHQIPFVDKHVAYLMGHPKVDMSHYLANLRLMLKKRS